LLAQHKIFKSSGDGSGYFSPMKKITPNLIKYLQEIA
jgi:hypothetical protein